MRRVIAPLTLLAALILPGLAAAQGAHSQGGAPSEAPRSEEARARYPQPLRAGDLAGRSLIEDTQQQRVLGRAVGATRGADGTLRLVVDQGGVLGFGTRRVLVPLEAVALLGHLLVLKDLDPAQLAGLPEARPGAGDLLPPDAPLRMGLARN